MNAPTPTDGSEVVQVTPIPWAMQDRGKSIAIIGQHPHAFRNVTGIQVAQIDGPTTKANARFIVTAVNHHQALVEALREARRVLAVYSEGAECGLCERMVMSGILADDTVVLLDTLLSQIGEA